MEMHLSKAERTRDFIIKNTAQVFNMKGYAGTSLSDLTMATGLTKGSIYGNFENKEEVALAVFDYNCKQIGQTIAAQLNLAETYRDKLMVYAKVYKDLSMATPVNQNGGCPILNTAIDADDTNALLKEKAATAVLKWKDNLIHLMELGIANKEFKSDINAPQVALSMIALIEGGIMIARVTDDASAMDSILNTVAQLINQLAP